jgi:predicted acyltransferase
LNGRYPLILRMQDREALMQAASRIFKGAAIYGVIVLLPLLVLETRFGQDNPPPLTHAEFYYGFTALALVWQVAFWIIGSDPVRFRPLMIPAMLEKFTWGLIIVGFLAAGRAVPAGTQMFAAIDQLLGVLFILAWRRTAAHFPPAR